MPRKLFVSVAQAIARKQHAGQFRNDGVTPYVEHCADVARRVAAEGDEIVAAGWLHDVLEQGNIEPAELRAAGIPDSVVDLVKILTHRTGETYQDYIASVAQNPAATIVKLADIQSNVGSAPSKRAMRKYAAAILTLIPE